MVRIENDCVDCPTCSADCTASHTPHYYCDRCGDETVLYHYEDEELCQDCIYRIVEIDFVEGICENCGEDDMIIDDYGLCWSCFMDTLEVVEGSEE